MDPSDLRELHENGILCSICHSQYFGSEVVAFFPECSVRHYFHDRCLTRFTYIAGAERSYRCALCREPRYFVSKATMPSDLPHRSTSGDSPPEDAPPRPPPPPPPPLPPRPLPPPLLSPPPKFAPGTSVLDAGEFVPQLAPQYLEEPKAKPVFQTKDASETYCNHCGVFLSSSAWTRFLNHVYCHKCSLRIMFHNTNINLSERNNVEDHEEMADLGADEGGHGGEDEVMDDEEEEEEEEEMSDLSDDDEDEEEEMSDLSADEEEEEDSHSGEDDI